MCLSYPPLGEVNAKCDSMQIQYSLVTLSKICNNLFPFAWQREAIVAFAIYKEDKSQRKWRTATLEPAEGIAYNGPLFITLRSIK